MAAPTSGAGRFASPGPAPGRRQRILAPPPVDLRPARLGGETDDVDVQDSLLHATLAEAQFAFSPALACPPAPPAPLPPHLGAGSIWAALPPAQLRTPLPRAEPSAPPPLRPGQAPTCGLVTALRRNSPSGVRRACARDPEAAMQPLWDLDAQPPLCAAVAWRCSADVVLALLHSGADHEAEDMWGDTAFSILDGDKDRLYPDREAVREVLQRAQLGTLGLAAPLPRPPAGLGRSQGARAASLLPAPPPPNPDLVAMAMLWGAGSWGGS